MNRAFVPDEIGGRFWTISAVRLIFICVLTGAFSSNLFGQFTLNFDDHYPPQGFETYYSVVMNPENFPQPEPGAGVVWDFSMLEMGSQIWYRQLPVSAGSAPNAHPGSEWLEWSEHNYDGYIQENYLSLGPNGVSFEGHFSSNLLFDYSEPRLYNAFPMNFGDVITDTWACTVQAGGGQPYNRVGEATFEYDGYGTLILPNMTLENAVRVIKTTEYVDDLDGTTLTYNEITIDWYAEGYDHFVASWSRIEGGFLFFPMTRVLYLRDEQDVVPELSLSISRDIFSPCDGECVQFTGITDLSEIEEAQEVTWHWFFEGANLESFVGMVPPPICYDSAGVFSVALVLTVNGVPFTEILEDEITVIEGCGPIANFDYTPIVCLGQCYDFTNTSSNAVQHFWTFEGAATPISEDFSPTDICYLDQTGIFNVTLTVANANGSSTSITQQVTVVNPPNINAGPDQTIIQGTTTTLSAIAGNGTGDFIWQPFEDVTCFSCPATTTYPLNETTTFIVFYEQSGGCQTSDTLTVFVEESFAFGVPNSFSPNGDGVNDILYVRGSNITRLNFMIYNRYGEEVFSTTDQSKGWDGTKNGRELNAGVFGYYLEVFQVDGTRHEVKGDVTLVR